MSGDPLVELLESITWLPNEYGDVILVCRECLTPLVDDFGKQIPVIGPLGDALTAGLAHHH